MGNIVRVEKIFEDTFKGIENIKGQPSIWFSYGDDKELDKVLLMKEGESKYPFLWYILPNRLEFSEGIGSGKCVFILAHKTNLDWVNDQRFDKVFDEILFPYMENMFKALGKSKNTSFSNGDDYSWSNFPNYSGEGTNKSAQLDGCDAIKIEVELNIFQDNEC